MRGRGYNNRGRGRGISITYSNFGNHPTSQLCGKYGYFVNDYYYDESLEPTQ